MEVIKKGLKDRYACYVLITCTAPSKGGKMEVEMAYEGDEVLASYLVDSAAQVFDDRRAKEESQ